MMVSSAVLALVAIVSAGLMYAGRPIKVEVPDVVAMSSVEAATKLGRADLTVKTHDANLAGHQAGEVVEQSVKPGTEVGEDTVVDLTVATGSFPIPTDLVGKQYDDAAAILEGLGLKSNRSYAISSDPAGTVLSVDPSSLAQPGDVISLKVAYSFFGLNGNDDNNDRKDEKKRKNDD